MQGPGNMRNFLGKPEVQWVAVCDLDSEILKKAKGIVDDKYGNSDCRAYNDYRELYARGDLDAVSIAVPDHWHAILSIEAVRSGLDVYGEKPFTHSLREGRALCNAVKRYGRVWQTEAGSGRRTTSTARPCWSPTAASAKSCAWRWPAVRVHRLRQDLRPGEDRNPAAGLDYDRWLGPAPYSPYCKARVHMNWRWNFDYAGGQLMTGWATIWTSPTGRWGTSARARWK